MKKRKKGLEKVFLKKYMFLVLAIVLLCSQELAATAASAASTDHTTHQYYIKDRTRLAPVGSPSTHQYLDGYNNYPDGHKEPVYKTCTVWTFEYRGTWTCECGKTNGYTYWTEPVHSNCGR